MGKVYESIDGRLRDFVLRQPVFFVATAPAEGHVNVSPKGMRGSLAVLGERQVAYLDYAGSGVETIAHLRDNGRITLMFCAFDGPPTIVRLHGSGEAVRPPDPRFPQLRAAFAQTMVDHGLRSVIVVDVERISDSCGWAVPLMEYAGERTLLTEWGARRTEDEIVAHNAQSNAVSIDGLTGLGSG